MPKPFSYTPREKLKSRSLIQEIFTHRQSVSCFPMRLFYYFPPQPLKFPLQASVGCSKRYFKRAVQRNRVKRQMREAWRTLKPDILNALDTTHKQLAVFILYTDKHLTETAVIKFRLEQALKQLSKIIHEENRPDS